MKKNVLTLLVLAALPFGLMAQADKKENEEKEVIIEKREVPDRKGKPGKKETQEIIIRQNGAEKDMNLKVEINGDKVTINGKPLSEFKDKNITINKRKMIIGDGNDMMQFDFSQGGADNFGEGFGEDFMQKFKSEDEEDSRRAFLGVTTEKVDEGVKIVEVVKGSAAEKAGLKKDDIITKVGDEKITGPDVLSDVISFKKPAEEVKISYRRNGKDATAKATLGKRKQQRNLTYSFNGPNSQFRSFTMPALPPVNGDMGSLNQDMFELQQNAFESAFPKQKKIGLKIQDTEDGGAVKVINVEDSSAAAIAGIKKDDLITEINGKKIDNTDDAREELVPDENKKSYKIKINRAGSEMNFDVKIPKKLKTANL